MIDRFELAEGDEKKKRKMPVPAAYQLLLKQRVIMIAKPVMSPIVAGV